MYKRQHIGYGVFAVAVSTALALVYLQRRSNLPNDTLLGILSHSTLALGLLAVGLIKGNSVDVMSYLLGDVLSVDHRDITLIAITAVLASLILTMIWKPLLAATVNEEVAVAEGSHTQAVQIIYLVLLASVIAVTVRVIGVLLITALLVIPAATARRFAASPESMALLAAIIGIISVAAGLSASLQWDTAAGPSIVVATLVIFLVSAASPVRR